MKRILIDDSIIKLSKEYQNALFSGRNSNFKKPTNGGLVELEEFLDNSNCPNLKGYISNIIKYYNKIIILQPNKFDSYFEDYFSLDEEEIKREVNNLASKNIYFYELVVKAMRYDAVRKLEFLPFVKKLGIKACVYCNAQFAITTEKKENKWSGKYELDHFYPKSKYPFLSISFFNLQPCCSSCNKTKLDKDAKFNLYTNDAANSSINPFSFSLDRKSILYYLLSQKEEDLKILLHASDTALLNNHKKLFHITDVYAQHTDIAEELLWKAKIYNKSYKEALKKSFSSIFSSNSNFNRFIIGNYDDTGDIHKRPIAKLTQDIAKQLGIIQ